MSQVAAETVRMLLAVVLVVMPILIAFGTADLIGPWAGRLLGPGSEDES